MVADSTAMDREIARTEAARDAVFEMGWWDDMIASHGELGAKLACYDIAEVALAAADAVDPYRNTGNLLVMADSRVAELSAALDRAIEALRALADAVHSTPNLEDPKELQATLVAARDAYDNARAVIAEYESTR